ncbi:unnamed protein product [Rotaria magnacalcarata]|nr:unnamed protein product [Rotaria magnacalcarata]CAF1676269.1 unnamed protein product [Rotaria magnacalcarata]CAF2117529.1 unnamed protein product [Rotaria magnacalcarata]CAF3747830.1 unnamed protein product [Rotaria magnacalcarata]CAF3818146.1 unnamed protein product [Rotaria magnacalcarata]
MVCSNCAETITLNSSKPLNITTSSCPKKEATGLMCTGSLYINYEQKTGFMDLGNLPDYTLLMSNRATVKTNLTMIWFDKARAIHSLQSSCSDNAACTQDVNTTYNFMKNFKYEELHQKLRELLHVNQAAVANLTCSDSQGRNVLCANGFCQFNRKDRFTVERKCVNQGAISNPAGLIVGSTSTGEPDSDVAFIYACNKQLCNGNDTNIKVQNLLIEYKIWPISETNPPSVLETSTRSNGNMILAKFHQPMTHCQWIFPLIITLLLRK